MAVAVGLFCAARYGIGPRLKTEILPWIRAQGGWAGAWFVAAYVLATVLGVPGLILTLGAGLLFGTAWGTVWVSVGSTLGATASFALGRFLVRGWVEARLQAHPRFARLDEALGREGWKIVGLLRLSPMVPFNLLNYALGVTRVRLRDYVVASWLGMLPATVLYVSLGAWLGETLDGPGFAERPRSAAEWALGALGLLATLAVTLLLGRMARRALDRRTP